MLTSGEIQERIEQFPRRCREAGMKVTHQRSAIYAMLAGTESHPSPEEVYTQIRAQLPSISLATVYKVLDQFHRSGFLRKVSTENQVARYDANMRPHHHLVCDQCGVIQDVDTNGNAAVAKRAMKNGFKVTRYDLIYHGICPVCQNAL